MKKLSKKQQIKILTQKLNSLSWWDWRVNQYQPGNFMSEERKSRFWEITKDWHRQAIWCDPDQVIRYLKSQILRERWQAKHKDEEIPF